MLKEKNNLQDNSQKTALLLKIGVLYPYSTTYGCV